MTPFDLLFIAIVLTTAATLVFAAGAALLGHRSTSARILKRLTIAVFAYLVVVYTVAFASPRRILAPGEDKCSDDWCIAVAGVQPIPGASERLYDVNFRLSSRARRITQRERGVVVYLRDVNGDRYEAERGPTDAAFDVALAPRETILTHRRFHLPVNALARDIVITRGGFPFPGGFIIGEASEVLHPPAVRLR